MTLLPPLNTRSTITLFPPPRRFTGPKGLREPEATLEPRVHECVRHLPELYRSHLSYSGVTLSPTCYFSQLAVSTTCYFSLLAAPLLAVSLVAVPPACHFPPLLVLCWLFLPLLFLALAASTAGRPSFCYSSAGRQSQGPLHLQELKSCSLSESTVHINLHCHNPYNVPDHSADVAAA